MSLYPKLNDSLYLSSDDEVNNSEEFELDGGSDNLGRQELFNRETRARHEQKKTPRVLNKSEFASGSSFPEIPRSERHSNATLSLEDFEQKYLGRRYNSQRRDNFSALTNRGHSGSRSHKQTVTGVMRLKHTVERGVFWLEHASKWRVVLVGCFLGLLSAAVYGELQLGTLSKDNHIPCSQENKFEPCLTKSQLKPALQFAHAIRDHLHSIAGQYECGDVEMSSRAVSLEKIQTLLPNTKVRVLSSYG